MPLPKRRHSKSRGRKRRTHWKKETVCLVTCSQCNNLIAPNKVCSYCGYFRGKKVVEIKKVEKKQKPRG